MNDSKFKLGDIVKFINSREKPYYDDFEYKIIGKGISVYSGQVYVLDKSYKPTGLFKWLTELENFSYIDPLNENNDNYIGVFEDDIILANNSSKIYNGNCDEERGGLNYL